MESTDSIETHGLGDLHVDAYADIHVGDCVDDYIDDFVDDFTKRGCAGGRAPQLKGVSRGADPSQRKLLSPKSGNG